jgi:plasmid stabilization system protein ParE
MRRELIFLPEFSRDFIEAFNYYEAISPGRGGERFEAAFKQTLQQIEAGVITHMRAFVHFHRVIVPGYPYNLYYRLVEERAVIAGVLYARFDPKRIQEMLSKRIKPNQP